MAIFILFNIFYLVRRAGQFAFTYNRGHGECRSPVSKIKSCTEDTRMMLNFQACPDVDGTESTGNQSLIIFSPSSDAFDRGEEEMHRRSRASSVIN
jgi:hypothetical protein